MLIQAPLFDIQATKFSVPEVLFIYSLDIYKYIYTYILN